MAKRQVFYSFHFDNDVMRVQQIRNIGVIEGNTPVSPSDWEEVKRKGDTAIKNWIDAHMRYRSCVIVLIGSDTANRQWVKYEIEKAWNEGKGLLGIYIHNIKCPRNGTCSQGVNPFEQVSITKGQRIKCHNPNSWDAYNDIKNNIEQWVEDAINQKTIDNVFKNWGW
jgi:hypothetical protein